MSRKLHSFEYYSDGEMGVGPTVKLDGIDMSSASSIQIGKIEPDNVNTVSLTLITPMAIKMVAAISVSILGDEVSGDWLDEAMRDQKWDLQSANKKMEIQAIATRFMEIIIEKSNAVAQNGSGAPSVDIDNKT